MPRLAGRSAGRQVGALVADLNTALAAVETETFAWIDATFGAVLAREQAWLEDYATDRAPQGLARDRTVNDRVWVVCEQQIELLIPTMDSALHATFGLAADSIEAEIELLASTAAPRFANGVGDGVGEVRAREGPAVASAGVTWWAATRSVPEMVSRLVEVQLAAYATTDHEPAQIVARVFSPVALSMPGNGGRGVWWQGATAVRAAARAVIIDLANTVRDVAMIECNRMFDGLR